MDILFETASTVLLWLPLCPLSCRLKTIAENQQCTAAATFGDGAMKLKKERYHLFHDDHVRMVEFFPGFATHNHCLFHVVVRTSFITTRSYSAVVALSKIWA